MDESIDSGSQQPHEDADQQQPPDKNAADMTGQQAAEDSAATPPPWPGVGDQEATIYRPRLFFRKDMTFWKYLAIMGPISLVPSLVLVFALAGAGVLTEDTGPDFSSDEFSPAVMGVMVVVVSPVIETLMMAGIIWLLSFLTGNKTRLAIMSAVVWGIFHSLAAPMWGFVIVWPFFVFSCGYLNWKDKSLGHGLLMAMALHGFQNLLPGVLIALDLG